jgi:hypothetical protein
MTQQPTLDLLMKAAVMPSEATNAIGCGDPVTGNDQGIPIRATGLPDCARR